ncbi:Sir2 family NAD+-dependent deacetylase [Limoniibacter endophyticus]|uniref:NAD-dependent protein deacylase n=1 Tax=Limoniibacter endophyticus TaxID=1565040 RepID=A0A8J3DMR7_9HYPH|nr:Sir2 family NAD+-dependent deacetylase [Limoniibacter endophyticus]GHC71478.1 NAD-dependent protein deacylase [Limoniibacter endophyticus]
MKATSIVVLTGAGISAESGVATFRDGDGLWASHRIEDVATPEGFARAPELVHTFYNGRRRELADVAPNAAHLALAKLEQEFKGDFLLVTQNIDDLHERAGSQKLVHMHGELAKALCANCGNRIACASDLSTDDVCSVCSTPGHLRPDVVWFGEFPYKMNQIENALERCDLFISIGTSGNVYPAAGFVQQARYAGARSVELNLEPSEGVDYFDESYHGPATLVVPAFVEKILATL